MATRKKARPDAAGPDDLPPVRDQLRDALAALEAAGSAKHRDGYARYGITVTRAFGVPMSQIQSLGKRLGKRHELATALWESGWYEARLLAAYVGEPGKMSAAQMDAWCRDFDNWGVCDTLCFVLFDRSRHAWAKVTKWAPRKDEFVRRAAFALLASLAGPDALSCPARLAGHDKASGDAPFRKGLKLIERYATDGRNFVKKGVSWALRHTGRRSPALNREAVKLAQKLAASDAPSARWIGRDAVRELTSAAVQRALAKKKAR